MYNISLNLSTSPVKLLENLPFIARRILECMFSLHNNCENVFPSYAYIAKLIGYSPSTVAKQTTWLVAQGYLEKENRPYTSNLYRLTDFFFNKKVYPSLWKIFAIIPRKKRPKKLGPAFSLSLLLSLNIGEIRPAIGTYTRTLDSLSYYLSLNGVVSYTGTRAHAKPQKKGDSSMEQETTKPDASNQGTIGPSQRIVNICRALMRRGTPSPLTNDDAISLYAYSDAVLDHVCGIMKHANPRNPMAFFISECKKQAHALDEVPNWQIVNYAREHRIVLLDAKFYEEFKTPKKDEQATTYSAEVKIAMERERIAAEARTRRFNADQLVDEIAGMKQHIETLKKRIAAGEPGMAVALMMAEGTLARREYELQMVSTNCSLISSKPKETVPAYVVPSPQVQKLHPVPNLFVNSASKGYHDEEDVSDTGECGTDFEDEALQGELV